jgi:Domain of unknown function (DUF4824)
MKRGSVLAAAIVLVANAFTLLHAGRNRSGQEADITLTQRELIWPLSGVNEDDSEISLTLRWGDPQPSGVGERQQSCLDEKTLHALGFDTSVAPSDAKASEFYQRQRARRAFVALEYDGPAWRKYIEELERRFQEHPELIRPYDPKHERESATRLIAIDASSDAGQLRARHPDSGSVIIVPAVIVIVAEPYIANVRQSGAERPARIVGSIRDIPSSIHIPRPYSDAFRRIGRVRHGGDDDVKYRVHLRYGSSLEPWVIGVEVSPPGTN